MEEPKEKKRKRKCDTHNDLLLLKIFHENGEEKNYPEITKLYNEEMGKTENNGWTQDQISKKMQNLRREIRAGRIKYVTATPETNQVNNGIDPTGKNVFLVINHFL